jgi:hypothetical protein
MPALYIAGGLQTREQITMRYPCTYNGPSSGMLSSLLGLMVGRKELRPNACEGVVNLGTAEHRRHNVRVADPLSYLPAHLTIETSLSC